MTHNEGTCKKLLLLWLLQLQLQLQLRLQLHIPRHVHYVFISFAWHFRSDRVHWLSVYILEQQLAQCCLILAMTSQSRLAVTIITARVALALGGIAEGMTIETAVVYIFTSIGVCGWHSNEMSSWAVGWIYLDCKTKIRTFGSQAHWRRGQLKLCWRCCGRSLTSTTKNIIVRIFAQIGHWTRHTRQEE